MNSSSRMHSYSATRGCISWLPVTVEMYLGRYCLKEERCTLAHGFRDFGPSWCPNRDREVGGGAAHITADGKFRERNTESSQGR